MANEKLEGSPETQREPMCPQCGQEMIQGFPLAGGMRADARPWCCITCNLIIETPAAPETPPDQNEEAFVLELAAIYGLEESFMRALPVPTLEMWKMLVRTEARRHKSERETMEKFRKELCDLKFGAKTPRKEEA